MSTQFRINGTNYSLLHLSSRVTTPSYCYRQNDTTYYTPLLTSRSQTIGNYVYNASSPTVCVRYNNTTYYAAKSRTENSSIPAGTYVGESAYNIFKKFISNNSYRILKYSVTIVHMGTARTFPANTRVWLIYGYSGGCINLIFQTIDAPSIGVDLGFNYTNSWWSSSSNNPGIQLRVYNGQGYPTPWSWNNFTITGGIKFK